MNLDHNISPDPGSIELTHEPRRRGRDPFAGRTFLLGNEGGFVLYLPVSQGGNDRTMHASKWFGASGFGRAYLEDCRVWLVKDGGREPEGVWLDRSNQIGFTQEIDRAILTFEIHGCIVRQTFFMPNRLDAFAMSLEADAPASFIVEPQLDMRYYQALNDRFDQYRVELQQHGGRQRLRITNQAKVPGIAAELCFYAVAGSRDQVDISLLPEANWLRPKVYVKDELRQRAIQKAYSQTGQRAPDEAPIWDQYETTVYAPAHITGASPLTLCFAFGDHPGEANADLNRLTESVSTLQSSKRGESLDRIGRGALATGHRDLDTAYNHILVRFDNALVARNVKFHGTEEHDHFNAIFAGNKYFLDAWKRDENISLIALLKTGDLGTVRAILSDTWRYQDRRTGRLPHIIRLGEPLVYYSSDGTLWALQRLWQYTRMSGDLTLLDEKYPMVEWFFRQSLRFVQRGLLPSGGIIDRLYRWETWMDTPFTPRDGYPVEIELLWLTVIDAYLPTIRDRNPQLATRLESTLQSGRESFGRFVLDGYLADSLSYHWEPRDLLTPNGYIAFGLGRPPSTLWSSLLSEELQRSMMVLARDQLAGRCGIRSLAPRDWSKVLAPDFLADPHNVRGKDMASVGIYNYHRGIEWLWLNQFFVAAEVLVGDPDAALDLYLKGQVHSALHEAGVAGLSELYDMHGPLGADFQAWSMASYIASLHEFGGVEVDAIDRTIDVRPCVPSSWEQFEARYQIGRAPSGCRFDVRYRRRGRRQEIEVSPVDRVPPGHALRLAARPASPEDRARVTVNGVQVRDRDIERRMHGGLVKVGVEVPFTGPVSFVLEHVDP